MNTHKKHILGFIISLILFSACSASGTGGTSSSSFVLTYRPGAAVTPYAYTYEYQISSNGTIDRLVTTSYNPTTETFELTTCADDSVTLSSSDLEDLTDAVNVANLLNQTDLSDDDCIGVGNTTYSYESDEGSNEVSVQTNCGNVVVPEALDALHGLLVEILDDYFDLVESCD